MGWYRTTRLTFYPLDAEDIEAADVTADRAAEDGHTNQMEERLGAVAIICWMTSCDNASTLGSFALSASDILCAS